MGRGGGGLMVSVLAFYSNDPSSNSFELGALESKALDWPLDQVRILLKLKIFCKICFRNESATLLVSFKGPEIASKVVYLRVLLMVP